MIVGIRKSRYIELDKTHYYTEKFNMALNLYRALGVAFYFSKSFSEVAAEALWSFGSTSWNRSSAIFHIIIETQIVFEQLLALVTSQLAIVGQLKREMQ